jgi:hypothetical protein
MRAAHFLTQFSITFFVLVCVFRVGSRLMDHIQFARKITSAPASRDCSPSWNPGLACLPFSEIEKAMDEEPDTSTPDSDDPQSNGRLTKI